MSTDPNDPTVDPQPRPESELRRVEDHADMHTPRDDGPGQVANPVGQQSALPRPARPEPATEPHTAPHTAPAQAVLGHTAPGFTPDLRTEFAPEPQEPIGPPAQRPSAPVSTAVRAATAALAAVLLAGTAVTSYVAGQDSYATPPGKVTLVEGATDDGGFAREVYRNAAAAVVRISQRGGGVGSGFFYAPGKIATNAHVVTGSPAAAADFSSGRDVVVDITLHDGRQREATVTALDTRLDLAVLTLDPIKDVPILAFAKDTPEAGSPLAVLGHPFGEGLMVTTGVLSGVSNNSRFAESDVQSLMLQIDAAVNPGNSGGPVLDAAGAVVGLVTLRPDEADGRSVAGLALAIPAKVASAAITQLDEDGLVAYPMLGVVLRDTTPDDPVPDAAEVTEVIANSGAHKAGLKVGDVVIAINDEEVTSSRDVVEGLLGTEPGDRITLKINGDNSARTVTVTLGSR